MDELRVMPSEEEQDSFMKMATEEAIMNAVREGRVSPTLRFYAWDRPAVALGFFQKASKELDLDACKKDGIEIFRRLTGGGAVYKSPQFEINYSFIIREDEPDVPSDIEESFKVVCGAVMEGLKRLGFDTEFKPINDIMLHGKKISGNAQTRQDNVLLLHGTVLLEPEVEKMFTYLKIDDNKLFERKVKSAEELVTGLHEYKHVSKQEIEQAIIEGFKRTFQTEFKRSRITPVEAENARELCTKYANPSFVYWG